MDWKCIYGLLIQSATGQMREDGEVSHYRLFVCHVWMALTAKSCKLRLHSMRRFGVTKLKFLSSVKL